MQSTATTLEAALSQFQMLRNHSPYRFSGKWFVAQTADGFAAYRTKKAAIANSIGNVWSVTL